MQHIYHSGVKHKIMCIYELFNFDVLKSGKLHIHLKFIQMLISL